MANNLKTIRKARGMTQEAAAAAMGVSLSQYVKLERSERRLNEDYIRRAAKSFGVEEAEVFSERRMTRIIGRVGAGAEAHFYTHSDDSFEERPMPPGGTEKTVGLEINGDSVGPFFNQWLVYYDDVRNPVTPDLMGKLCIVETIDGRVLVKKLMRGSTPNHFHLLSMMESPIEDQELVWAAEVTAMTPR